MKFTPILCIALLFANFGALGQSSLPNCNGLALYWTNCHATQTYSNGNVYVGEFKNGKRDGTGTFSYVGESQGKGDVYVGGYKNGFRDGVGTYSFANGNKYVGDFKEGQRTGKGIFLFSSGSQYVGDFKDGKREGQGVEYSATATVIKSGLWSNGLLIQSIALNSNDFPFNLHLNNVYADQNLPAEANKNIVASNFDNSKINQQESSKIKQESELNLNLFVKKDVDKNIAVAIAKSINNEELADIRANLLFLNNTYLRLKLASDYQKDARSQNFSQAIPFMQESLEKQLKEIDKLSSKLGLKKYEILQGLGLVTLKTSFLQNSSNDEGFLEATDKNFNFNINQASQNYLYYFGENSKNFETKRFDHLVQLSDFYKQRPPKILFGQAYQNTALNQIKKLSDKIVTNAHIIETDLIAEEKAAIELKNKKLLAEKEMAEKRILEAKKIEEERRIAAIKREEYLKSPEGKKQLAADQQAEKERRIKFLNEYPYYAEVSCINNFGGVFQVHGCFSGSVPTYIEITNGKDYKFLQLIDIMQINLNFDNAAIFNLRSNFKIKMQQSGDDDLVLSIRLVNRSTGDIFFQKKVGKYGVINYSK